MKKKNYILFIFIFMFLIIGRVSAAAYDYSFTTASSFECRSSSATTHPSGQVCSYKDTTGKNYFCLDNGRDLDYGLEFWHQEAAMGSTGRACAIINAINSGKITVPAADGTYYFTSFNSTEDIYSIQEDMWNHENSSENCVKTTTTNLPAASLGLSSGTINMTRKSIGGAQYYAGTITVNHSNLKNNSYTITKSNNDLVVSETEGGANVTSSTKKALYVRIPVNKVAAETNYTINFTATYNKSTTETLTPFIEVYQHGSAYQRLGLIGVTKSSTTNPDSVTGKVTLKATPNPTLRLRKVDASGNLLPGSTVNLRNNSGALVEIYNLTNGEILITNMPFGKFCMIEKTAPEGYILSREEVCTTLSENNIDGVITLVNNKTKVRFKKVWYDKEEDKYKQISNASFHILNASGAIVKDSNGREITWVTDGRVHEVEGLKPGKYTLVETNPPTGYSKVETIPFELKADGTIVCAKLESTLNILDKNTITIVIENTLNVTQFSKQDATTGKELPGATLQILDENKQPILDEDENELYKWVSTNEPYIIEGLPAGKYYLKEITQPEGYQLNEELVEFIVKDDGTVTKVVMKNEPYKVPDTGLSPNTLYLIGGIVAVLAGIGIISFIIIRKRKIN